MKLRSLALTRFAQGHHPISFFIHIPGNPANGSPFAGSVPTVEQDDQFFSGLFEMALHLDQFRLVRGQLFLVVMPFEGRLNDLFLIFFLEDP